MQKLKTAVAGMGAGGQNSHSMKSCDGYQGPWHHEISGDTSEVNHLMALE